MTIDPSQSNDLGTEKANSETQTAAIKSDMIDNPAQLPYVENLGQSEPVQKHSVTGPVLIALSIFFTILGFTVRYGTPNDVSGLSEFVGNIWIGLGVVFIIISLIIYRFIKKYQSNN